MILDASTATLSTFSAIVDGFTPESSSVIFHVIAGVLLARYCPAVGDVIVITGATFSLTFNCKLLPSVLSVASFVVVFPASSVAFTVTG